MKVFRQGRVIQSLLEDSDDDIEVVAKNDCVLVDLNSEEAEVSVFGGAEPIELKEVSTHKKFV